MKKMILIAALVLTATGIKAQDCEALMLPYFGNDRAKMEHYQTVAAYKFEWRCAVAQAAFYESDTVPAEADLFQISEVKDVFTGKCLSGNYVVNLNTLSYYAYNFKEFQLKYPHGDKTLCFATPRSAHPYLVLRSIEDMHDMADEMTRKNGLNR